MIVKVILHNSISLDGSFLNFDVNMGLHYRIAGSYKADVHLIGSKTAKTGIEMYGGAPAEEKKDFIEFVENNAEILDEKSDKNRRINASIITTRSYPQINFK